MSTLPRWPHVGTPRAVGPLTAGDIARAAARRQPMAAEASTEVGAEQEGVDGTGIVIGAMTSLFVWFCFASAGYLIQVFA